MNDLTNKINDIKPIVEIPDNSFFIFSFLVFISLLFFTIFIFFIIKLIKNRKKSDKKIYFEILKNIDLKDSKLCAYSITKYSRLLASNEREKKLAEELIEDLEKYKYKKEVEDLDEDIKIKFLRFLESLDV